MSRWLVIFSQMKKKLRGNKHAVLQKDPENDHIKHMINEEVLMKMEIKRTLIFIIRKKTV